MFKRTLPHKTDQSQPTAAMNTMPNTMESGQSPPSPPPTKTTLLFPQVLIAVLSLIVSGCFWPEKFDATLDIEKDKHFSFVYDGILAYVPAVQEIKKSGALSKQDDLKMAEIESELRKDQYNKFVSYVGNGRFKVRYERAGIIDRTIYIFGDSMRLVTLSPSGNGVAVEGMVLDDQGRQQLREIGLGYDGTLRVRSALEVVQDNATSKPVLGFGAHAWKLNWGTQLTPRLMTSSVSTTKPIGISPFWVGGILAVAGIVIWRMAASRKTSRNEDKNEDAPIQ